MFILNLYRIKDKKTLAKIIDKIVSFAVNAGLLEKRSGGNTVSTSSSMTEWNEFFGQTDGTIGKEQAMRFSAVYACVDIISKTIATLPIGLYKKTNGIIVKNEAHKVSKLLEGKPNEFQTWFEFTRSLMIDAASWGNGYGLIERNRYGQVIGIRHLTQGECSPFYQMYGENPFLYYYVFGKIVQKEDIIHIKSLGSNGIEGKSPISLAADSISLGIDARKSMSKFYKAGNRSKPAFEIPTHLDDTSFQRLRNSLTESMKDDKVLILEDGLTLKPFSISPRDAEVIASLVFTIEDIARFYSMPLHKIQSLQRSTNNNIEQQSIDFVTGTIMPWVEQIEQELKAKLMAGDDPKYVFKMNVDYLMRGESDKRAAYYSGMFQVGGLSPDEIRVLEGYNPVGTPEMGKYYLNGTYRAIDAPVAVPPPAPTAA